MMLNPRLINCVNCANIDSLLKNIDCKIFELTQALYNNISLMLNKTIPGEDMIDLLNYKRILIYKYNDPTYAENYSLEMITSKVKLLTLNCNKIYDCNCNGQKTFSIPISTTTTSSSTTTTTTTIKPSGIHKFYWELSSGQPERIGIVQLKIQIDSVNVLNVSISSETSELSGILNVVPFQVISATMQNAKIGTHTFVNKILKDGVEYQVDDICNDCEDELITYMFPDYVTTGTDTTFFFKGDILIEP